MKAILPLILLFAFGFTSLGHSQTTKTTTTTTTTITKITKEENSPSKDSVDTLVVSKIVRVSFTKAGISTGIYNFWEPNRNLSSVVNTPLPAGRRFGLGFTYQYSTIRRNRHWYGMNAEVITNFERKQYGYNTNNFAGNIMLVYGVNVNCANSKTPFFPFINIGMGSTSVLLSSTNTIAASNLTTQFSSVRMSSTYLAYKVGFASMTIGKKGFPTSIIQIGYAGGINNDKWVSGTYAKVEGLKAFALKGVFLNFSF